MEPAGEGPPSGRFSDLAVGTVGGPIVRATELERQLLAALQDDAANHRTAMWQLVVLYSRTNQPELAQTYAERLLEVIDDAEGRATVLLALGQIAEMAKDYEVAGAHYQSVIDLDPQDPTTRYFALNNRAYVLNLVGQFADAETCCRAAIDVSASRFNAHKNLGVALEAQGRHVSAAESFIEATRRNPMDFRAAGLLEDILRAHPEVETELASGPAECRKLVDAARTVRENLVAQARQQAESQGILPPRAD